jgi:hypothetical protein
LLDYFTVPLKNVIPAPACAGATECELLGVPFNSAWGFSLKRS